MDENNEDEHPEWGWWYFSFKHDILLQTLEIGDQV